MRREDLDRRLEALHEAAEHVSANLVELEIDSGRQLLEVTALTGESAARWSEASAALTELWRQHGLLTGLLEKADKLRGSRRTDQLGSLLDGASIELTSSDVPLPERALLGSSRMVVRCSADELLAAMSASFEQVKSVVVRIGSVWDELTPKLEETRRLLDQSRRLADELGESERADLESSSDGINELTAIVTTDPLSASAEQIQPLLDKLIVLRDRLEATARFKHDFQTRAAKAHVLLEDLRAEVLAACEARDELVVKVSAPAVSPPDVHGLSAQLLSIAELADTEAWETTERALESWTEQVMDMLATARRARDANRAPIAARNELRALLEAYRVKAKRLGLLEQPALEAIHAQARDSLFTAPTDLAVAAQLVRSYQEALTEMHPAREALL